MTKFASLINFLVQNRGIYRPKRAQVCVCERERERYVKPTLLERIGVMTSRAVT